MKRLFHYHRAEFNGKYLRSLAVCPNYVIQDVLDELAYHTLVQWKLNHEIGADEVPIRRNDLINIAKFAGLFLMHSYGYSMQESIVFTPSHIVGDKERSERGLLDMHLEDIRFVREEQDDYADDITNEASEDLRTTLVPEGTVPVGYLPYGVNLYDDAGDVIWDNLLDSPPENGVPYTVFYGEKFLTLGDLALNDSFLTLELFKELFECIQRIRYNGPSIAGFLEMTRIIGAGYIRDIHIIPQGRYYCVYYQLDNAADVYYKLSRLNIWLYICTQKYKLFVPIRAEE